MCWNRECTPKHREALSEAAKRRRENRKDKWCPSCKTTLPIDKFKVQKNRIAPYCTPCYEDPNSDYRLRTRATNRRTYLRRYAGITEEQYDAMVEQQGPGCAICGATESVAGRAYLPADHDHVTGKFRGILCENCNVGIGYFNDSPERMRAAAEYIERSRD